MAEVSQIVQVVIEPFKLCKNRTQPTGTRRHFALSRGLDRLTEGQTVSNAGYAGNALYPEFRADLQRAHERDPVRGVVEIGGLSRVEHPKSSFVSYELIREIMQRAMENAAWEKETLHESAADELVTLTDELSQLCDDLDELAENIARLAKAEKQINNAD